MKVIHGEMDERQILDIIGRYNALVDRRRIPISEIEAVLGAVGRDLQAFFIAFGYTVDPPVSAETGG